DGLLHMYRPGTAGVPVWLPWPLPLGWLVAGFAGAGDERTGVRACAVALAGPNPLGGPADMVVVAEEPGIGLGAALAGLDVVAPTDHDTVAGHAEAWAAAGPVILLPGMELSCRLDGCSLHMLAYVFDPDQPDLAAELTRIRDDRVLRARAMVDRLAGLGVDVSWEQVAAIAGQAVVGRPHIARAMADSGAIVTPREAFTG